MLEGGNVAAAAAGETSLEGDSRDGTAVLVLVEDSDDTISTCLGSACRVGTRLAKPTVGWLGVSLPLDILLGTGVCTVGATFSEGILPDLDRVQGSHTRLCPEFKGYKARPNTVDGW